MCCWYWDDFVGIGLQMDLLHSAVKESHEGRKTSQSMYGLSSGEVGWTWALRGAAICCIAIGAMIVIRRPSI